MTFNWDDRTVLHLIEEFHKNDILWNPKNPDYRNRNKRNEVLNDISTAFDIDKSEIERKLKNLTSHYFRELRKVEESKKSATCAEDVFISKWFAFNAMSFLRDKKRPAENVNSEDSDNFYFIDVESKPDLVTRSRKKRRISDTSSEISEPVRVSKDTRTSLSQPDHDEIQLFGDYIASKIRKMDKITSATVQHQINNIIYQAEMGSFSQKPTPKKIKNQQVSDE